MYSDISNVYSKYAGNVLHSAKIQTEELSDFLSFHHNETKSFHEFWKQKEDLLVTVERLKQKLDAKKESLWINRHKKDFSKWDLKIEDAKTISKWVEDEDESKKRMLAAETSEYKD